MAKSEKPRRKFRDNWNIETYRFRQKLLLLKHLRDTKHSISNSMARALMDEEIRNKDLIMNDLEPTVIPKNVYPIIDSQGNQINASFTGSESTNSSNDIDNTDNTIPEAFNPDKVCLSSDNAKNNNNRNNTIPYPNECTKGKDNELFNVTGQRRIEYVLPTITDLEETGLKEYYNSFLNSATWQISNLNVKPGDSHFIFWFITSSYIPLICSCSGPFSNVFSLLAIICPWKINKLDPSFEHDPFWCYLVNSISIVFALISNMFLLLNYRKKIRYTYCQVISISGWGIACIILTVLIIVYHVWFYANNYDERYIIGEGFWFAVVTVVLHFFNFLMLLLNECGFLLNKYKPVFNIDKVQETLIVQTIAMGVWLIVGAAIFTRFLNIGLGDSFFYCIVSIVTIGDQSVVSDKNVGAQTLTSVWIVFGLVMFGLIVTSVRQMMLDFSSSTLYWHRMESMRRSLLKAHQDEKKIKETNHDTFNLIKNIQKWSYTIQGIFELTISLIIFMITLMCGALAIALLESWSYKSTVYFCFFNLMTLGQGDQAPMTPGGKTLFCAWALAAIPVMTILVSTSSDFVFSKLTMYEKLTFVEAFIEFCITKKYLKRIGYFFKEKQYTTVDVNNFSKMRTKSMIKVDINDENSNDFIKRLSNDESELELELESESKSDYEYNNNGDNDFNNLNHINSSNSNNCDINTPKSRRHNSISKRHDKKNDMISDIPIVCHPVDMLYNVILDSNGVENFEFVNSQSFVRSNTATIQLANYFREGKSVNPNFDMLHKSRHELAQQFKSLDDNFDINEFTKVYEIDAFKENTDCENNGNTGVGRGVINDRHIIMTNFKKKEDFILDKLSRIQIILLELRNSIRKICNDINHNYTYEEWEILFKITQNDEALNDNLYWIEDRSPLAFPMSQPKYFTLHYMRHLELFIQQFAAEWDDMPGSIKISPNHDSKIDETLHVLENF